MKIKLALIFTVLMGSGLGLMADSPLTSTEISTAYKDKPIVIAASKAEGKLTNELMNYISNPVNPIDIRIAVINELSWDHEGVSNADLFFAYLNRNNKFKDNKDFLNKASWDLLICMAYLKALDNYFDVDGAIELAKASKSKNNTSYTVNIICALIEAQQAMNDNWCKVYNLTNNVRINHSLKKDMNDEAINNIFEYMDLYKEDCK
jgi:hypothetical protein